MLARPASLCRPSTCSPALVVFLVAACASPLAGADDASPAKAEPASAAAPAAGDAKPAAAAVSAPQAAYAVLLKDATKLPGLIPLHRKDDKLYAELSDSLLGKEFFVLTSIARGIGERSLLGGMSIGFGDDWVWQFRKVDDTIQVVRRSVRFFAAQGSPESKAVDLAYTDSAVQCQDRRHQPVGKPRHRPRADLPHRPATAGRIVAGVFLRPRPVKLGTDQGLPRQC